MKIRIADIAESIKYGPHYRSEKGGTIRYIFGGDFDEEYNFVDAKKRFIHSDEKSDRYLLEENDILFAAKGFRNFAWRYTNEHGPCISSSLFFVMKINEEHIDSEYFTLLINSPRMQNRIKRFGIGRNIPMIPRKEFMNIKISVPSKSEQEKAVEINNLMKDQIRIEREILQKTIDLKNGLIDLLTKTKLPTNKEVL